MAPPGLPGRRAGLDLGALPEPGLILGPTRRDLERLEAARRAGPVEATLDLPARPPRGFRADEALPLFDHVRAKNPDLEASLRPHLPPAGRPDAPPLSVTAIIPSHRRTPLGLAALRAQDCDVEVLVLANGDFEPEGDRVLRVPWTGHGATRQRGVEAARGDYLLLTVDDALPRGAGCIRAMVEALEAGGYDAVFGRQVPWPSSDPITRARLRDWTPPGRAHRWVDRLDHVFALYRRETLLAHPLPPVPIGEDLHWRQGRRIGYAPGAPVIHAHPRRPLELYRRSRDLHRQHIVLGEPPRVPDLAHLLRALPSVMGPMITAGPREVPCQVAELLGQWRAARMTRTQPRP